MTDNIIEFPHTSVLNDDAELDPKEMLEVLKDEVTMTEAMVIGWTDE